MGNDVAQKWKYNGVELDETTGLYEMDFRQYDAAIGRFTGIDPVTHFNQSTYTAFDNNPVYWADPSGTNSTRDIVNAAYNNSGSGWTQYTNNGDGTFSQTGRGSECDDCPKEGQTRPKMVAIPRGGLAEHKSEVEIYHSSVDGGQWLSENDYFEQFRGLIRSIGQGTSSIEVLNNFDFTDDMLISMVAWASQAYEVYGGKVPKHSGQITPMYFDSPFFAPGMALKLLKLSRTSKFAFWSGKGTEAAAINSGYKVLGQTRAGQNLANLTANMIYEPQSQAWHFWGRLSQALARKVPKRGTANVFLTREAVTNPNSIWNVFEKPILLNNNVKIKYNWVD